MAVHVSLSTSLIRLWPFIVKSSQAEYFMSAVVVNCVHDTPSGQVAESEDIDKYEPQTQTFYFIGILLEHLINNNLGNICFAIQS